MAKINHLDDLIENIVALCGPRTCRSHHLRHRPQGTDEDDSTLVRNQTLTIEQEKRRQKHFINLIPSENFTSQAVLDALGSVMQSKADDCWTTTAC